MPIHVKDYKSFLLPLYKCSDCPLDTCLGLKMAGLNSVHCKKGLAMFPSPAGMSLTKLSLAGNNLPSPSPGKVWSEQIQESRKCFYSVYSWRRPEACNEDRLDLSTKYTNANTQMQKMRSAPVGNKNASVI